MRNASLEYRFLLSCLAILLSMFLLAQAGLAGVYYVRPGASGSNSGSEWGNAFSDFPETLVRGSTYYLASGNYGSYLFNTPEEGTLPIIIKKATVSEHGTDTGWDDAYGLGQAVFGNSRYQRDYWNFRGVDFSTGYWTFDGVVGSGSDPDSYGFTFATDSSGANEKYLQIEAGNTKIFQGMNIAHVSMRCSGLADRDEMGIIAGTQANVIGAVLRDFYVDNCQVNVYPQGSGWIIERGYLNRNWATVEPVHHGVPLQNTYASNMTVRYNIFKQCPYICIEVQEGGKFYGNIFDPHFGAPQGIVSGSGGLPVFNSEIYNNTVVNSTAPILSQNSITGGSGNRIQNNLFYDSNGAMEQGNGGPIDHNYNAFFSSYNIPPEANRQVSTLNPFKDLVAGDYHLVVGTDPGISLPSPYDIDFDNAARGKDGTWDRGAFEFTFVDREPPSPPAGLRVE